jgi:hypothetical protein
MASRAPRQAWLLTVALAGAIGACAQTGAPPGGPPDKELPALLQVLPDSNAVNVRTPAVVLRFDEVISERSAPTGGGAGGAAAAAGLAGLLLLSPSDGRDEVIWRREVLELRPRRGFRPNTAYRVTLLPGLTDLRGNRVGEPFSFVFATGPTIPTGRVRGVLFDWTTGRPAANARIELFLPGDTTFRWSTRSDTTGRFVLGELGAGTYEVRAWVDANNDRRISFREVSDTARVTLGDSATLELYAFVRDTLRPRLEAVELVDSTALRLKFERGLVADWDGQGATLVGADSVAIPLGGPFIASTAYDSLARIRRAAAADSARRAGADSARADAAAADTAAAPARDVPVPAPLPVDTVRAPDDTLRALPPPVFRRRVPVQQWTAPLAGPLAPGTYRVRIVGPLGLNGRAVEAEREFRVRPPQAPRDSTARPGAPSDSTARGSAPPRAPTARPVAPGDTAARGAGFRRP